MKTGIRLIAAERERQIHEEKWTAKHDDEHQGGEMAMAAACYAATEPIYHKAEYVGGTHFDDPWPWVACWDGRNTHDNKRRLVIAGALIAAELDRLGRIERRNKRTALAPPHRR